ncbi:glycosyltransferase [Paenibacillus sp. 2KB_20]|uniref:glycosyltransferase n=1 Tax=Paenibacillus TaxID=44249 RepID=UPI001B16B184|nr:glycosyltransferase [Paenibacillus lautus]GIP00013.1 glycosyl transferase [Paenibacillus lautus]
MKAGKVAVITRTKNRNVLLRRAIESVLNQSFEDWIMVIVNDGGEKEGVCALVDEYRHKFNDKVVLIHNEDSIGMEAASNKGIKSVNSKYVVIHDDDDSWDSKFLLRTVEILDSTPHESFKGCVTYSTRVIESINGNSVQIKYKEPYNTWLEGISLYRMAAGNVFPPISFIFHRSVFDEIGYYREDLPVLGDWDFHLRFMEKYDIFLIKECLANYHHRLDTHVGEYSNSVIGGHEKHIFFDTKLRNELLRKDLENNKIGLGFLVNMGKSFELIHAQISPIETIANKVKRNPTLKRIAKFFLRSR